MGNDIRNVTHSGILDHRHGYDSLLFFGGYKDESQIRDDVVWELNDLSIGWQMLEDIKLPENVTENALKIVTMQHDFC